MNQHPYLLLGPLKLRFKTPFFLFLKLFSFRAIHKLHSYPSLLFASTSISLSLPLSLPHSLPPSRVPVRPSRPPQFRGAAGEEQGGPGTTTAAEDSSTTFVVNGIELDREETRRARVLYDYDAVNESEITVYCDEVCSQEISFRLFFYKEQYYWQNPLVVGGNRTHITSLPTKKLCCKIFLRSFYSVSAGDQSDSSAW